MLDYGLQLFLAFAGTEVCFYGVFLVYNGIEIDHLNIIDKFIGCHPAEVKVEVVFYRHLIGKTVT
jgi:hypothetical protein